MTSKPSVKLDTVWRNNKSGELYLLVDYPVYDATDNTPEKDQDPFVYYRKLEGDRQHHWVRKYSQFLQKFQYVKTLRDWQFEKLMGAEVRWYG